MSDESKISSVQSTDLIEGEIIDTAASTRAYVIKHKWRFLRPVFIAAAIDIVLALLKFEFNFLYILPWVWPIITYVTVSSKIRIEFLQEYCKRNGYSFADTGPIGSGRMFDIGHDRRASNVISGNRNGVPFSFYSYSYTVGYGKSAQHYSHTVFAVDTGMSVPPLLLRSDKNPSGALPMFSGLDTLELEGNFNDHFSLRTEKGLEVEVLQLFTPDVMVYFIDKATSYSLEGNNTSLYLCVPYGFSTKKGIDTLFEVTDHLLMKFLPVLSGMQKDLGARAALHATR